MTLRRDVLLGIGASAASVAGAVVALGSRSRRLPALEFAPGQAGAPIAGDAAALAGTAGKLTPNDGEGPFYTPGSPLRGDIRDAHPKVAAFILSGRVLDTSGRPIPGAVLDFWQTGDRGRYDNQGYGYRGHQYTDEQGRYRLVTVRPSQYTAMSIFRTPHIHAKVQGSKTPLLTTQLYMPDAQATNAIDGGYMPSLLVDFTGKDAEAQLAAFDFVLGDA